MASSPVHARLADVLEPLGLSFALFTRTGSLRWQRTSDAWRRLLRDEPRRPLLEDAARKMATDLQALAAEGGTPGPAHDSAFLLSDQVRTRRGTYRLFGTCFEARDGPSPGFCALVAVAPPPRDPLGEDVLRHHFHLTRREAELVRLLVRGMPNAEIAERMRISPHTAHHYTERVLLKLGVNNRTQVAAKLLLAPGTP